MYVDSFGEFQLCPGLTKNDSPTFFLGSTIDEAISHRNNFNLTCNKTDCIHHQKCSYGCREKAFVKHGNVNAPEQTLCYLMDIEV